jgi:hypothetical protein
LPNHPINSEQLFNASATSLAHLSGEFGISQQDKERFG